MKRRQFLKVCVGALVGGFVLPRRASPQEPAIMRLNDRLSVVARARTNVVALSTGDGAVVVDSGAPQYRDALMESLRQLSPGARINKVFNTHYHPDNTGANELLRQSGATIVAHENTRLWLTTDVLYPWNGKRFTRLPKAAQPNKTFYTTGQLTSDIRYGYIPDAAHTDGDMYVHFPKQNVLAVGDAVCADGWPTVDYATGGWIGGIVGALQRLQAMADADTRIVPARGPVIGLTELKAQLQMYATIYGRLTQLLNKGRSPVEAVAANPTKEFDAQMGNPDEFVRRAFESLWGYLSPDA